MEVAEKLLREMLDASAFGCYPQTYYAKERMTSPPPRTYTLAEITAAMAAPYAKAKAAPTAERAADLLSQGLIDALKALPVPTDSGSYASPND